MTGEMKNLVGIACAVLSFCLYWNSLEGELVFDDTAAILANDDVQMKTPWSNLLWNDYWGTPMVSKESHKSYRPLTVATFRLNYMLHELQPLGYHLVNVLLHSAVCYLYVLLCGVVFSEVWPALIAGLLFAVHPIHTEAVSGVVGRAELLSAIFFILSFASYRKSKLHENCILRGGAWLLGSLLLAVASMLSKEQGITVVAVCIACDFLYNFQENRLSLLRLLDTVLTDAGKTPTWLRQSMKRALIMVVFTAMTVVMRINHGAPGKDLFHKNFNPPVALDTPYRQLSWLYLTFINSWLLLNPWNLNVDWRFGGVPIINSLIDPLNLLTLLTLVSLAVLGVWSVCGSGERHRTVVLALSLLVLPYLPASNLFFPVGFVVAERILYLPSMGFCMLVGYGAWRLLKTTKQVAKSNTKALKILFFAFISYVTVTHAIKTVLRNPDWQSHIPLFTSGLQINPHNGLLLANLGKEIKDTGDWEYAEKLIEMAVEVSPTHSGGHMNLGKIRYLSKRYEEAIQPLRDALEIIPFDGNGTTTFASISYMLAVSLSVEKNTSRMTEALHVCDTALGRDSVDYLLYLVRSSILLDMNHTTEGLVTAEAGIKHNRSSSELYYNIAVAQSTLGDREKAKESLHAAIALNPDFLQAANKLALMYSVDGQHDLAMPLWEKVRQLEPANSDAYNGIATGLFLNKDYKLCEEILLEGFERFPENLNLVHNLGKLYYMMRRYELSVHYFELVLRLDPEYKNVGTLLEKARSRLGTLA